MAQEGLKKPEMSCQDLVLVDKTWGASVLGRGDLDEAKEA